MNIAIFASQFYPHAGGVEEATRQLAHELARQGHRPVIITNRWPRNLPPREKFENLAVWRYAFRVPTGRLKWKITAMVLGPLTLRRLCSDLEKRKTQLIHVQCVSSNAYYAISVKERLGVPLVVTLQGELTGDATGLFQRSAFARETMRNALDRADAITACSHSTLKEAEKFFNLQFGERASVVYNGIRLNEHSNIVPYLYRRPYILGLGRLVPQKGFDILLRAFAMTLKRGNETHDLILAGEGFDSENLKALADELKISDRVIFLNRALHTDAVRLFSGCSFFVLPSRVTEGLPLVILEAMASGKAVIASRVGGVPEVVLDGETGILVPPEDVDALSAAIDRLITDVKLKESLGVSGRERARKFTWPDITRQYISIYKKVCLT